MFYFNDYFITIPYSFHIFMTWNNNICCSLRGLPIHREVQLFVQEKLFQLLFLSSCVFYQNLITCIYAPFCLFFHKICHLNSSQLTLFWFILNYFMGYNFSFYYIYVHKYTTTHTFIFVILYGARIIFFIAKQTISFKVRVC